MLHATFPRSKPQMRPKELSPCNYLQLACNSAAVFSSLTKRRRRTTRSRIETGRKKKKKKKKRPGPTPNPKGGVGGFVLETSEPRRHRRGAGLAPLVDTRTRLAFALLSVCLSWPSIRSCSDNERLRVGLWGKESSFTFHKLRRRGV